LGVNIKKIVAQNLRGYRKLKNLTQEAVGIHSKLNPNQISRIEREDEEANPTLTNLERIAKTLGIDAYMLLIPHSYKKRVTITDQE